MSDKYDLHDADGQCIHLRRVSAVIEYRLNSSRVWQEVTGAWLVRQPPKVLRAFANKVEAQLESVNV